MCRAPRDALGLEIDRPVEVDVRGRDLGVVRLCGRVQVDRHRVAGFCGQSVTMEVVDVRATTICIRSAWIEGEIKSIYCGLSCDRIPVHYTRNRFCSGLHTARGASGGDIHIALGDKVVRNTDAGRTRLTFVTKDAIT